MESKEIMDFLRSCMKLNGVEVTPEEWNRRSKLLSDFLKEDLISNAKEFRTFLLYFSGFIMSLHNLNESVKQGATMLENEETANILRTITAMLACYCNKFESLQLYISEKILHSSELAFEVSELREQLLQNGVQVQQLSAELSEQHSTEAAPNFEARLDAKIEEERQQSKAKIEELEEKVRNLTDSRFDYTKLVFHYDSLYLENKKLSADLAKANSQSEAKIEEERQRSEAKIKELEEKVRNLTALLQQSEEEKNELKKNTETKVTVFNLGRQKMLENVQRAKETGVPRKYNKTRDSYDEKYGEMVRKMYLVMGLSYAKISEQTTLAKKTVERLIKVKGYKAEDRGQYLEYNGVLTHKSQLPKSFIEASAPPKKRGRPTNEEQQKKRHHEAYLRRKAKKAEQGTAPTVEEAVKAVEGTAPDIDEPEFSIFDGIDFSE